MNRYLCFLLAALALGGCHKKRHVSEMHFVAQDDASVHFQEGPKRATISVDEADGTWDYVYINRHWAKKRHEESYLIIFSTGSFEEDFHGQK